MGGIITKQYQQPSGQIDKPATGTGTGVNNPSTNSETNHTGERTRGTGTGERPIGTGTGQQPATGTGKEKEIIPVIPVLKEDSKEERNRKRRERYAKQKAENGGQVKPRKVNKKGKEPEPTLDINSLNMIVGTVFGIIASRPNCEQWALSQKEIDSITTPLSKMLAESQAFANMGEYSNQIALVMACFTIFVPRLIITVSKQKEVKKVERTKQRTDTNVKQFTEQKTKDKGTTKQVKPEPTNSVTGHGDDVSVIGLPIY